MSAIAGIMDHSLNEQGLRTRLLAMLETMRVPAAQAVELEVVGGAGLALGRVAYGPEVAETAVQKAAHAGGAMLMMAGELFLDRSIKSYSEFIMQRYIEHGTLAFADGLNGSFSAAICDSKAGHLIVATDHMNTCPIFVAQCGKGFYFASEVKAFGAIDNLPWELDLRSVLSTLTNDQLMNLQTWVQGVQQMPGASVWELSAKGIREHRWYSFSINVAEKSTRARMAEMDGLLQQALRRRTRKPYPALTVTGGVDSRTMLCYLENPSEHQGFTYTTRHEHEWSPYGDSVLGKRAAETAGVKHAFLEYDPIQILRALDSTTFETDGATCLARENIYEDLYNHCASRLILTGDENFGVAGGLIPHMHVLEYVGIRPLSALPHLWSYLRQDRLQELIEISDANTRERYDGNQDRPANDILDELCYSQRNVHFVASKRWLCYRHGVKVRQPFFDLDLLKFVQTLPSKWRIGKALVRKVVAKRCPVLSKLPRARSRDYLGYRREFWELQRKEQKVSRFIFERNPKFADIFNVDAVQRLVEAASAPVAEGQKTKRTLRQMVLQDMMPVSVRMWLTAAARRFLKLHSPYLTSEEQILLRIMEVASAVRQVSGRFAPESRLGLA